MPIGTIIGFLLGACIASTFIVWIEAEKSTQVDKRSAQQMWLAEHRTRYLFWASSSAAGLIGTFIEILVR